VSFESFEVEVIGTCCLGDDFRELLNQQRRGLSPEDAPTGPRQINREAQIDGGVIDQARRTVEHGLAAGVDGEIPVRLSGGSEGADQVVSGRAATRVGDQR
jgi:hypothetical protein